MGDTIRTAEIDDAIVDGISQGIPLAELCRKLEIGRKTVYDWQDADPAFATRIALARKLGYDAIADQCLAIADETSRDTHKGRDGQDIANAEWISRSKLRVETRLKLLAKWDPKRYGDKLDVTSGGKKLPAVSVSFIKTPDVSGD